MLGNTGTAGSGPTFRFPPPDPFDYSGSEQLTPSSHKSGDSDGSIPIILGYDSSLMEYEQRATEKVAALLIALDDKMYKDDVHGINALASEPSSLVPSPRDSPPNMFSLERRHNFETHNRPQVNSHKPTTAEWTEHFPFLRVRGFSCAVAPTIPSLLEDGDATLHSQPSHDRLNSHTSSHVDATLHDVDVTRGVVGVPLAPPTPSGRDVLTVEVGSMLPWFGLPAAGCGGLTASGTTVLHDAVDVDGECEVFASDGELLEDVVDVQHDGCDATSSTMSLLSLCGHPDGSEGDAGVTPSLDPSVHADTTHIVQHILFSAAWNAIASRCRPLVDVLVVDVCHQVFTTHVPIQGGAGRGGFRLSMPSFIEEESDDVSSSEDDNGDDVDVHRSKELSVTENKVHVPFEHVSPHGRPPTPPDVIGMNVSPVVKSVATEQRTTSSRRVHTPSPPHHSITNTTNNTTHNSKVTGVRRPSPKSIVPLGDSFLPIAVPILPAPSPRTHSPSPRISPVTFSPTNGQSGVVPSLTQRHGSRSPLSRDIPSPVHLPSPHSVTHSRSLKFNIHPMPLPTANTHTHSSDDTSHGDSLQPLKSPHKRAKQGRLRLLVSDEHDQDSTSSGVVGNGGGSSARSSSSFPHLSVTTPHTSSTGVIATTTSTSVRKSTSPSPVHSNTRGHSKNMSHTGTTLPSTSGGGGVLRRHRLRHDSDKSTPTASPRTTGANMASTAPLSRKIKPQAQDEGQRLGGLSMVSAVKGLQTKPSAWSTEAAANGKHMPGVPGHGQRSRVTSAGPPTAKRAQSSLNISMWPSAESSLEKRRGGLASRRLSSASTDDQPTSPRLNVVHVDVKPLQGRGTQSSKAIGIAPSSDGRLPDTLDTFVRVARPGSRDASGAHVLAGLEIDVLPLSRAQTALPRLRVSSPDVDVDSEAPTPVPLMPPGSTVLPKSQPSTDGQSMGVPSTSMSHLFGVVTSPVASRGSDPQHQLPLQQQQQQQQQQQLKGPSIPTAALPPRVSPRTSKLQLQSAGSHVLSNATVSSGLPRTLSPRLQGGTVTHNSVNNGNSGAGIVPTGAKGRRARKV